MSYYQSKSSDRYGRKQTFKRSNGGSRHAKKDYIHPSKFVKSAKPRAEVEYVSTHKFADFDIHPVIQENLKLMGYTQPSPIQDQTIPAGLEGKDIVGLANTGTGKTAAFAVPLLNKLLADKNSRAIILAPTRELAQQIEEQCKRIAKGSGLSGAILIGGLAMGPQLRQLRNRPQIIIGTPGRIIDHLERKSLDLASCNLVVLDEVDRMLDMGFVNDITSILQRTCATRQSFYFSATLDAKVKTIIETFSHDPVTVSVKSGETSDNIEQNVIAFNSTHEKVDKLHDLLIQDTTVKALVFDDTHRSVEKLSKELAARGFASESIHGGMSQGQRQRVLNKFKENHINILVATDVAARGLDVFDISHVVNYSAPRTYDDYVHRIGRTGRAGKIGYALTFVEQ